MINLHFQPQVYNTRNFTGNKPETSVLIRKNESDILSFSSGFLEKEQARKLKKAGDEFVRDKQEDKAVHYYKRAINIKPDYPSPYYSLARIYEKKGQTGQAAEVYKKLLTVKPDEAEAHTLIGHIFRQKDDYKKAKESYKKAVEIDPKYDFANRALKETNNLIIFRENPVKAGVIKRQEAQNNLRLALELVNQHAAPDLTESLKNLEITFGETDSLSGHKNIAQYEHYNKKIVITNDYIWAAPEITAAYIIHEAVHAKDRDGLSSVREEQDAYQASIEFWIAHNKGIKDPELDYAAGLYRENPAKLRERVAETYRSRDKSIPEYSPNHIPPDQEGMLSKFRMYFFSVKDKCAANTTPIN